MTELRAADLRFTTEETHQFIQAAALSLSDEDVETLTVRTEGWVAGLQLAALSMQGREDSTAFIRDFGGSNRFVLDYLAEEVLSGQPPDVQQFLMRTSILGRLCGDLCDAVTGLDGGQAILESFVQDNLFTAPLDTERRWYRYHHLFADVLRSHLRKQDGAAVPDLHRRAARWLEQQGLTGEAVEHAMAAGDLDQAAILIERIAEASFQVSNQAAVLGWLGQLPEEAIQRRPKLALTRAWGRFVTGDWEGIPPALEAAALAVLGAPPSKQAAMQAQLNAVQAWASYQMGDLAECVSLAEGALADLPPDGLAPPRVARAALGCALVQLGETGAARTTLADAIVESQRTGDAVMECLTLALAARAAWWRGTSARLPVDVNGRSARAWSRESRCRPWGSPKFNWAKCSASGTILPGPSECCGQGSRSAERRSASRSSFSRGT